MVDLIILLILAIALLAAMASVAALAESDGKIHILFWHTRGSGSNYDVVTHEVETFNATIGEENGETATYFNLNGQKISGVPTQRGIYIVNGKKIVKK